MLSIKFEFVLFEYVIFKNYIIYVFNILFKYNIVNFILLMVIFRVNKKNVFF